MGNITTLRYLTRIKRIQVKAKQMKRLNKFLPFGAAAVIALTSCSTSFNAMKGGETDDLYFMASDARVATEFAVRNNNPENFRSLNTVTQESFEQENFSARNVNPEFIARYSEQSSGQGDETVYFDDAQIQENAPNVNVYNNFYGTGANGMGWNQPRMNLNLGLGFGFGGGMWGNPWMMPGFGWGGMGMMGMGMWDPFWDPFWPGMGFGPGFGWGMRPGFGFGWNSMWGMNAGFGWGGMWGNPWMRPGFGWGGFGPGWGWGAPGLIVVNPGWGGSEVQRRVVRGGRPGTGSTMASDYRRGTGATAPTTARAARRDAVNSTGSSRDFARSQNDLYSGRNRVANTAGAGNRTTSSAAATRPTRNSAVNRVNPAYNRGAGTRGSAVNPAATRGGNSGFNNRATMPSNRSASPSYNRGTTRSSSPAFNNRGGGSQNTMQRSAPARSSGMSAPSNRSSSFGSAPSRGSSGGGGGFSSGGGMRGGGGGMSSGGGASRGGRGN